MNRRRMAGCALIMAALLGWAGRTPALSLLGEHPVGKRVTLPHAPPGLERLANYPGRVSGYLVDGPASREDHFFYVGDTAAFNVFLKQYAEMNGIEGYRLIIHPGKGVVKSLFEMDTEKSCDWMLERRAFSSEAPASGTPKTMVLPLGPGKFELMEPGSLPVSVTVPVKHSVEIHVWTKGNVDLTAVEIPKNVEVVREPGVPGEPRR